jgi:hypothetical protein
MFYTEQKRLNICLQSFFIPNGKGVLIYSPIISFTAVCTLQH